jgi:hypothetical protein
MSSGLPLLKDDPNQRRPDIIRVREALGCSRQLAWKMISSGRSTISPACYNRN